MKNYLIGFAAGCCDGMCGKFRGWRNSLMAGNQTKAGKDGFDLGADLFVGFKR